MNERQRQRGIDMWDAIRILSFARHRGDVPQARVGDEWAEKPDGFVLPAPVVRTLERRELVTVKGADVYFGTPL